MAPSAWGSVAGSGKGQGPGYKNTHQEACSHVISMGSIFVNLLPDVMCIIPAIICIFKVLNNLFFAL